MKKQVYGELTATATVAGGCFWCVAADLKKLPGVIKVVSGYAGGRGSSPTYEDYVEKGYIEAVQIVYQPHRLSYEDLLNYFLRHIDPTDPDGQFSDRGPGYVSAVFYHGEDERRTASRVLKDLAVSGKFDRPLVTQLLPYRNFYPAEMYHQDYELKNPLHYQAYRAGSGRAAFIERLWKSNPGKVKSDRGTWQKPDDATLRNLLNPIQYEVTQHDATEPPFQNEYVDNRREGIYVDVVSGEPLFSSLDKYDSGCGWPSFSRPLEPQNVVEKEDLRYGMKRIEVRSKHTDSHLGHVFPDGPGPDGIRYCMNSAAMRFIPKENLAEEGYGRYLKLFEPDR